MSDSDSTFKGESRNEEQNFQKILSDNNAVLEPVKLNDHHALGVIDVFAKNLNFNGPSPPKENPASAHTARAPVINVIM